MIDMQTLFAERVSAERRMLTAIARLKEAEAEEKAAAQARSAAQDAINGAVAAELSRLLNAAGGAA